MPTAIGVRSKPRVADGLHQMENIRDELGLSKEEFSIALGFKTNRAYQSAIYSGSCSQQLLLAAKGLLAEHVAKNGAKTVEKSKATMIVEIDSDGAAKVVLIDDAVQHMTLNGKTFLMIPLEDC